MYKTQTNIENSLVEFLLEELENSGSPFHLNEKGEIVPIDVRIGFEYNNEANLPLITLYADSKTSERAFIGSNRRAKLYLLVIDIRALNVGQQQDLADWVEETINDGFTYYEYDGSVDPLNPVKTKKGYANVDFLTNEPLRLGDNADIFERYRQNITIAVDITKGE